jgi:hypothetical protein
MVAIPDNTDFRTRFKRELEKASVVVLREHRVAGLDVRAGRATGVVALATGGGRTARRRVGARSAVVLATAGYQANRELRLRFQPEHLRRCTRGLRHLAAMVTCLRRPPARITST